MQYDTRTYCSAAAITAANVVQIYITIQIVTEEYSM